jgi:hypothetical protein
VAKEMITRNVVAFAALIGLLLATATEAKDEWHKGRVVYVWGTMRDLTAGRTDLYHSGEYTCTPGTEHYAPDCRKAQGWFVREGERIDATLEDGTVVAVDWGDATTEVFQTLMIKRKLVTGGTLEFEYRLRHRRASGPDEINIKGVDSKWYPMPPPDKQKFIRQVREALDRSQGAK